MAVTLNSTGITFSDGNSQNTAASAGMPTSSSFSSQLNASGNYTRPSTGMGIWALCRAGGPSGGRETPRPPGSTAFGFVPNSTNNTTTNPFVVGTAGNYNPGTPANGQPGNPTFYGSPYFAFVGSNQGLGGYTLASGPNSVPGQQGLLQGGGGGARRGSGQGGCIRFINIG